MDSIYWENIKKESKCQICIAGLFYRSQYMEVKKAVSAPFTKGVNFTNWLEFRKVDQVVEDLFDKEDFSNVKSLGCDVVRLPIHFEQFCFPENDYIIPDKIFSIMDRVVEWVSELNMYIIFDFHNSTHIDSVTSDDVADILFPVWAQIADRYKDASEYVVYELMNEPHGIEIQHWNKIIAKLFKHVRSIDSQHYIIVGGADWNSFRAMKTLPDFKDDKVIYTFHFYDPHTFTHQGAPWCHMERVVNIPFPYDPDKMPALPENPTAKEKECFENYPNIGTLEETVRFFDQYAEFSCERNAPVYCGEFGAFGPTINKDLRVSWYKLVADLLEERNIARTSWDYYGPFGLFEMGSMFKDGKWVRPKFPNDLNRELLEAMRLFIPD